MNTPSTFTNSEPQAVPVPPRDGLRAADPRSGHASLAEAGADVRTMFNRVALRYDTANRVMSGGVDIVWRRKAIAPRFSLPP